MAFQWLSPGSEEYQLVAPTTNARSGRVPSIAYIKEPIALWYGTFLTLSRSWGVLGDMFLDSLTLGSIGVDIGLQSSILKHLMMSPTYLD